MKLAKTPLVKFEYMGINLYIKRDDLYPIPGGGNKGRKAEYILEKCIEDGCNAVVTCGGAQSNHLRAIAIRCKELGITCTAVIHADKPSISNGNLKLLKILGVKVVYCRMTDVAKVMDEEMAMFVQQGFKPFYIWGGGHCLEGTRAFYDAVFETHEQAKVQFDYVFHASGTGATQAGLHLGFKTINSATKVVGISIARQNPKGTDVISHSILEFIKAHNLEPKLSSNIILDDNYIAGGYEKTNSEQLKLIQRVAEQIGVILDPTYTGKAWYGMQQYIESGSVKQGSNVLFWHTGGLLNLMATNKI